MYDNYISDGSFRHYREMLNDYIDGYCKLEIEEIEERIYRSYEEGRLSDSQYDYLSNMTDDLK